VLLGDLIARFEDDAVAAEVLMALGDVALMARVGAAAAEQQVKLGEFATNSVARFATCASDEDWVTMIGTMARTDDPGRVLLDRALSAALAAGPTTDPEKAASLSQYLNQDGR